MHGVPRVSGGGCEPVLNIAVRSERDHEEYIVFKSLDHVAPPKLTSTDVDWLFYTNKYGDGGIRAAGDVKVQVLNQSIGIGGAKQTPIFHTWAHSQFMEDPPDEMSGVSRRLSPEESTDMNLPPDTHSLLFQKGEIDGAAKDVKNTHFPADFKFEIFWKYLPGETGTGSMLEDQWALGMSQAASVRNKKMPKIEEKQMYIEHCISSERQGTAALPWHSFILSLSQAGQETADPASQVPDNPREKMLKWRSSATMPPSSIDTNARPAAAKGGSKNQTNHVLRHSSTLTILRHSNEEVLEEQHFPTLTRTGSPRMVKISPAAPNEIFLGGFLPLPESMREEAEDISASDNTKAPSRTLRPGPFDATIGFPSSRSHEPPKEELPDSTSPRALSPAEQESSKSLSILHDKPVHPAGWCHSWLWRM